MNKDRYVIKFTHWDSNNEIDIDYYTNAEGTLANLRQRLVRIIGQWIMKDDWNEVTYSEAARRLTLYYHGRIVSVYVIQMADSQETL